MPPARGVIGIFGAKLSSWRRRHPWRAAAALALAAALLGWAGYRAGWYLTGRSHFRAAQKAYDRHDWSAARTELDACLRAWPDSADAQLLAARTERRLTHLDRAEEQLAVCERLRGETQAVKVERALIRLQRGDLAGTEPFLRACIAQDDPDTAEILDALAAALILDYRVPEAHRCLDDLLRRQPDNFDALLRHAQTAQGQAWYTVTVESLQRALDLRPDDDEVRLTLAHYLLSLGRYTEAMAHLTRLRETQPGRPAVTFALARCRAGQGEKERAIELLDGLLADGPDDWRALNERGWLALELDRPAEAEGFLRRAVSLAPPDQTLLTRLADCLRLLGKHDEARKYRDEADRLRADTLRALALTQRYREEGHNDPDVCYELGTVLLRLGQKDDALRFWKKALERDPHHRPTHQAIAAYYARAGALQQRQPPGP
jgi:tetratricopeptide (TPR) repeat protein